MKLNNLEILKGERLMLDGVELKCVKEYFYTTAPKDRQR